MGDFLSLGEHEAFKRHMDSEHTQFDRRLLDLEKDMLEKQKLLTSIERLAVNMEHIAKIQDEQGQRLRAIEERDGEQWRKTLSYVITCGISLAAGFLFNYLLKGA